MSIRDSRIILDTNVWVFGLRGDPEYHACSAVLENLSSLQIVIPRQVLIELQLNRNAPHLPFRLMTSSELLAELTQESA